MLSLVFTYWTTTLDALEWALSSRNMAHARIDGSLGLDQRRRAIERFQSEPDLNIILLSFGTGSVGQVASKESNSTPSCQANKISQPESKGCDACAFSGTSMEPHGRGPGRRTC